MKLKILLFSLFVFFAIGSRGQNLKSQLFADEGISHLQLGNFAKADSLFDIALSVYPNVDAYFNKALTRLNMKDQCGFCDNMYMAAFYEDVEADSLYNKYCLSKSMMLISPYDSLVPVLPDKAYERIAIDKCGKRETIEFYNQKDSLLATLQIINKKYYYSKLSYKARYPGGTEMLDKFIANNMNYPKEAADQNIQGRVYASFVINEQGKVQDARIVNGVHPLLDEEALRVIRMIPKWYAATSKGKPVREVMTLHVDFTL